ncbi:MAG: methyltransferase domain-containing protein, partial [Planctomycetota bacterium]
MAAETGRRHFRVLDVASGGGDVAIDLQRRAAAAGIELDIVGCDISETAIQHAQASVAKAASNVRFEKRNVLTDPPAEQFDIVTCSLFLHHLRADDAVALLENLSQVTGQLLLVNDLVRSRWGKLLADVACRVLSRSSVVHVDGPRSVEGAFTLEEAVGLCRAALLDGALVG